MVPLATFLNFIIPKKKIKFLKEMGDPGESRPQKNGVMRSILIIYITKNNKIKFFCSISLLTGRNRYFRGYKTDTIKKTVAYQRKCENSGFLYRVEIGIFIFPWLEVITPNQDRTGVQGPIIKFYVNYMPDTAGLSG